MFRDPLIQKAWEMHHQVEHFPTEVLQEAAVWLEEKRRIAPSKKIAVALVLQYLGLAIRQTQESPTTAKEDFSRALRW